MVPYTAGGSVDTVARIVVAKLSKKLGQTIVVENKCGASGLIGAKHVARAVAHEYTLLFNASIQVEMPQVMGRATYDAEKDFSPVSDIGQVPLIVVTNPKLPVKEIKEFVDIVCSSSDKYTWATSGYGT